MQATISSIRRKQGLVGAARLMAGSIWSCLSEKSAAGGAWAVTKHATKASDRMETGQVPKVAW